MIFPLVALIILWAIMLLEGLAIAWLCVRRKDDRETEAVRWLNVKLTAEKLTRQIKEIDDV